MNRTSWILFALLVATNALWLIREGNRTRPPDRAESTGASGRERADRPREQTERPPVRAGNGAREAPPAPGGAEPAGARGERWIEAMSGPEETRRQALEQMKEALAAGDRDAAEAALRALWLAPKDELADPAWLAAAQRFWHAEDPGLRRAALLALEALNGLQPEDRSAAAADPAAEVRAALANVVRRHFDADSVEDEDLFLRLLADPDANVVRTTISAVPAGAGPRLQEAVVALARDGSWRAQALPTLAQLVHKSDAVLTVLIQAVVETDAEGASTAASGLLADVPAARQAEVADSALRRLEHGADAATRRCVELVGRYGRETDIARLESALAEQDEATRQAGAAAIAAIRRRQPR